MPGPPVSSLQRTSKPRPVERIQASALLTGRDDCVEGLIRIVGDLVRQPHWDLGHT